ncbi:MAG: hypothetical protein M1814_005515 [Vezdaea aestivalis]|nr:MAG: hypothetical protein M1814_005515 [Vezdaea aestivalis]
MAAPIRDSDALPSINQLNFDKGKVHGPPLPSPTSFSYPGPPPPYSYPISNPSSAISLSSPIDSHRPPLDDKALTPIRTALPSIQEVIRGDSKFSLNTIASTSTAPSPISVSHLQRAHTASAVFHNSHVEATGPPPITHGDPQHQRYQPPPPAPGPTTPTHANYRTTPSALPAAWTAPRPSLPPQDSYNAPRRRYSGHSSNEPPQIGQTYKQEPPSPVSASAPYNFGQTFQQPPPNHVQPRAGPPSHSSFRPTSFSTSQYPYGHHGQRFEGPDLARVDELKRQGAKSHHGDIYGFSVRRHLDHFDLDSSLREVIQNSQYLLRGTEGHLERFKTAQGTNQSPVPVPTSEACDDMIRASQNLTKTLTYVKEMLMNSQDHLAATEQSSAQAFKPPLDDDEGSMYEDPKSGTGTDSKKRRAEIRRNGVVVQMVLVHYVTHADFVSCFCFSHPSWGKFANHVEDTSPF